MRASGSFNLWTREMLCADSTLPLCGMCVRANASSRKGSAGQPALLQCIPAITTTTYDTPFQSIA